ncbi:MAG TPA: type II secretion system protein [Chthonomonadales bacterium]|nr:type II secretion system protein [Chthonomonadales bacterium]
MTKRLGKRGFTLIELLTVIAIISVLTAILFPLAGTVRQQARESNCMSKLHQLWVAAEMFRQDEGKYPATLLGYVEAAAPGPGGTVVSSGAFLTDPASQQPAPVDALIRPFLYKEYVRDLDVFRSPNNAGSTELTVTVARFPRRPPGWPADQEWVGDRLAGICGVDAFGTIDCFNNITAPKVQPNDPLFGQPKFYYTWDSYSISPRVDATGFVVRDAAGAPVYDVRYSTDWTGRGGFDSATGTWDMPNQLKYANPPLDQTLLALTTWHAATAGVDRVTVISASGSARKARVGALERFGANLLNH